MIIGLCGRTGSGKSTVGEYYASLGINYIDTDKVSREVTSAGSPCLKELAAYFGETILSADGSLNRPYLASLAMNDENGYRALNEITHRYIVARTKELVKGDITVIDAPLLFESGLDKYCDTIIGVVASDASCIRRVRKRDNITLSAARARLARQKSNGFLYENCDYIIENRSNLRALLNKARKVLEQIKGGTV